MYLLLLSECEGEGVMVFAGLVGGGFSGGVASGGDGDGGNWRGARGCLVERGMGDNRERLETTLFIGK